VIDASLSDIKFNLNPVYTEEYVSTIDKSLISARGLDGTEFFPGYVAVNDLKGTNYMTVVLQMLCIVKPLRDYLLLEKTVGLSSELSKLTRKIWNPKSFKSHISPHSLMH
jgi:U4/U6.U5 tri-snRNP-associated protein 2